MPADAGNVVPPDEARRINNRSNEGGREAKGRETGHIKERDQTANLLALYTQNQQAKKLRVVCPSLPPIESKRRTAIGARWKQVPLSAGRKQARLEQCGDSRSSLIPDGKRRHGEPGILSQQRHETGDVRSFPEPTICAMR